MGDLRNHCVLLVEDNRVQREVAAAALQRFGWKVVPARDAEEALLQLIQQPFSLVLMDIEMPWMKGIRTAERILELKKRGTIDDIPVVALTGDHSEDIYEQCIAAGMLDVIPKHIWKPKWKHLVADRLQKWIG